MIRPGFTDIHPERCEIRATDCCQRDPDDSLADTGMRALDLFYAYIIDTVEHVGSHFFPWLTPAGCTFSDLFFGSVLTSVFEPVEGYGILGNRLGNFEFPRSILTHPGRPLPYPILVTTFMLPRPRV